MTKRKARASDKQNDQILKSPPWDNLDFKIEFPFELNNVHKSFVGVMMDPKTKMLFVNGPAGTAKTYLAVYGALQLLKKHCMDEIVYIRSVVESASQKMGSLPGEVEDKFLPWSMPLVEKLDELVGIPKRKLIMEKDLVHCVPVNFVRGLTFNNSVVIIDEAQNLTKGELITILTRFGTNSKFIVVGDSKQADINDRTGFAPVMNCFDNKASEDEGIYTFEFGENEIVRSEILKFIVKQLEQI